MLTEDLFDKVLIAPAAQYSPDTLNIISGYASPLMVYKHFGELSKRNLTPQINLIVGMVRSDGITEANHKGLVNSANQFDFDCRYIASENSVHAKVYTWLKKGKPILAFSGSANYTVTGFNGVQREILTTCDSYLAQQFYELIWQDTISCKDRNVKNNVTFVQHRTKPQIPQLESVELSLLHSRTGETHEKAGLNWGQRSTRNRNQAYIPIPSKVYRTDFFPPVGQKFNVLTDDGESLEFTRAQERGKALHTSNDNSLMGFYFRKRLGVGSGEFVTTQDLIKYGRKSVSLFKADDNTYFLDFSDSKKFEEI